jgi:GTP1/Obg family GTP-binding protein
MDSFKKEYWDLIFERDRYKDAKAEELLGRDPALLKLYYLQINRYQVMQKLQERLMALTGINNPLFNLAIQVSNDQDLADRAGKLDDLESVANDVADVYDQLIEHLQSLVTEVRQQAAELLPISDETQRRLREASSMAFQAAEQQYGGRIDELRRRILAQSKNPDADRFWDS